MSNPQHNLADFASQYHDNRADHIEAILTAHGIAENWSLLEAALAPFRPGPSATLISSGQAQGAINQILTSDFESIDTERLRELAQLEREAAEEWRERASNTQGVNDGDFGMDAEQLAEAEKQLQLELISQHLNSKAIQQATAEHAYQIEAQANQEATETWGEYWYDVNIGLQELDSELADQLQLAMVEAESAELEANYELNQIEQSIEWMESLLEGYLDGNGEYDFSEASLDELSDLLARLKGEENSEENDDLPDSASDLPPPPSPERPGSIPASPIVLNLQGEAIDTTGLDEEIHFDLNGNGFREQTGWITPDQGFLVLDRNGDGIINDGTELFGNWTELESGTTAANGFEALAEFDENGDGVIDAQDSIYSELRVWVDLDQDGVSDSGELFTLAELGIASISLEYSTSNHTDEHGNEFRQWGHFTTVDGIQRDAVDIWFHKDPTLTREQELDVSADIAALPDMQGYGTAHSLHQAMVRDETGNLKVLVKQFTEETDSERRQELIEDILYEWTGQTEDDKTKFGNRYDFVDGRKIGVLEAFTGHSIGGPRGTGRQYAEQFHGQFNQWASVVYSQLMMQSHLSDIFAEADFTWNEELQTWTGHFDQSTEALVDRMLSHPDQSAALLSDYISVIEGINPYNNANKHAAIASMLEISQNHDLSPELANLISSTLFEGDQWLMTAFTDALAGDSSDLEIVQNWMAGHSGGQIITGEPQETGTLRGTAGDDLLIAGKNDRLYAGGGNDTLIGAEGARLYGESGDNLLVAATGSQLQGGSGSDTYQIGSEVLTTTIRHNNRNNQNAGTLSFGDGIKAEDLRLERHGSDLHFVHGDQRIVMNRWFDNHRYRVAQIQFADGEPLDISEWLQAQVVYSEADPGDQTLNGHSGMDHMVGHDEGVNTLRGGNGDDTLIAGKNDRLYAGGGNDTLIGAEGARLYGESGDNLLVAASGSQLYGGSGTDTFLFKENVDGASVQVGSASDKAVFENADPSQIWLSRSGNHLLIDLLHTEETVRIDDWFRRNDRQLAELKAGDSVAATAQIEKLVSAMAAFSPSEASDDSGSITSSVQEELKDVLSANWGTAA